MAKEAYKYPKIFVACSYRYPFDKKGLESCLRNLPVTVHFLDSKLKTKQLFKLVRESLAQADFSLFDVSTWNANVSMELGLAEGRNSPYYILLNSRQKKGVPADLQGLQRIEYTSFHGRDRSLEFQFVKYFLSGLTYTRRTSARFGADPKREKLVIAALRILGFLRDHGEIKLDQVQGIAKGLNLRLADRKRVLKALHDVGVVRLQKGSKYYALDRDLFKKWT
jgi:hypothetical protein